MKFCGGVTIQIHETSSDVLSHGTIRNIMYRPITRVIKKAMIKNGVKPLPPTCS